MGLLSMLALVDNLLPVAPGHCLICQCHQKRFPIGATLPTADTSALLGQLGSCRALLSPAPSRHPAHCPAPNPAHSPTLGPVFSCSCVSVATRAAEPSEQVTVPRMVRGWGLLVPCLCMQQGSRVGSRKEKDSSCSSASERPGTGDHGACQTCSHYEQQITACPQGKRWGPWPPYPPRVCGAWGQYPLPKGMAATRAGGGSWCW